MDEKEIQEAIDNDSVVLFMKGDRLFPMCGFSQQVVAVLEKYQVEFKEYNVLADQELRENIKTFSNWPTIPQLYMDGEFIGGCDIVIEMLVAGELDELFKKE